MACTISTANWYNMCVLGVDSQAACCSGNPPLYAAVHLTHCKHQGIDTLQPLRQVVSSPLLSLLLQGMGAQCRASTALWPPAGIEQRLDVEGAILHIHKQGAGVLEVRPACLAWWCAGATVWCKLRKLGLLEHPAAEVGWFSRWMRLSMCSGQCDPVITTDAPAESAPLFQLRMWVEL